jgi:uncharacterized membrane protein
MQLSGGARRATLVVHVVTSVGWLGAVAAFLALAVAAVRTADVTTMRALYVAMEVLGAAVLVPLSLASLASGLLQSLGTPWGLLRHWWVIAKLALSVLATGILLLYTSTLRALGDAAASPSMADDQVLPSFSPLLHATGGLAVLLVAAALSVFKPKGLTRYGWRKQQARRTSQAPGQVGEAV